MGLEDLLKEYMAKKNPYGSFAAQGPAAPATAPAPAMGPAPSLNTHAPVVPGAGSWQSALLDPLGAAKAAAQTPGGAAALQAAMLDPAGTIKAGGVNMDELKQGMAAVATKEKEGQAAANDARLQAAGAAADEGAPAAGPRVGGPVVIPGGWQSTISPEARAALEGAFAQQGEAIKLSPEQREALKEQNLAERELANRVAQGAADVAGAELGRAQAETAKADATRTAIDSTNKELAEVNAQIDASGEDPGRFWKNAGTLGSAMMGIGAALGAFGEAFAGVKNRTFEMVDQAIARDIASQRADLAKKTGQRDNLLKRLADQTGSLDRAEQLADYAMRQSLINSIKAKVGAAEDGAIKARGDAMIADLEAQQKQRAAGLAMQKADAQMKTEAYVAPRVMGGGGGGAEKQSALMFEAPDGSRYIAKDAKARDELATKSAAVQKIQRLASQMDKIRESGWTYVPGTSEGAKAQALGSQFLLAVKDAEQLGAITKSDLDTVGGITGDPTSLFSRAGQKSLDYAKTLDQSFKDRLKAETVEQVRTGYKVTPQGNLAPASEYTGKSPTKTAVPAAFKEAGQK